MTERRGEGFLGRWSRLKADARQPEPPLTEGRSAQDLPAGTANGDAIGPGGPPELPPVDSLTFDSDFTGFLHPDVDEGLRRTALRKLFSDPHFNVMDGLDVYIDDYSVSDPIPAEMLAGLKQAQRILRWAEGRDDPEEPESVEETDAENAPEAIVVQPASASPEPIGAAEASAALPEIHAKPG